MTIPVITIARQIGSHGDELGDRLSQRLGIPLLAQEVLDIAAKKAGVALETIAAAERVPSWMDRVLDAIGRSGNLDPAGLEPFMPPMIPTTLDRMMTSDDFRRTISDVVLGLARRGPCVIVGHAGQVALRDVPNVLRVYVHAPSERRIARVAVERNLPLVEAKQVVREDDQQRGRLFSTYYGVRWDDPDLYALTLNTGVLHLNTAVDLVMAAAIRMAGAE